MKRKDVLFFLIILILSTGLVVYKFSQLPKGLAVDEVMYSLLALSLNKHAYIPFSPIADGHPTLYFYTLLASFKLFGVNVYALRLPSAIFGIINVVVFYFILKIVFKNKTFLKIPYDFLLSIIFITSHWRLNFNRFSFDAGFFLLTELLATLFLIMAVNKKEVKYFILVGIFSGLAFHSYQPGRIFFLVPLIYMFLKKIKPAHILAFLIPLNLLVLPLAGYIISHPTEDIRVVQLFYPVNNRISLVNKVQILGEDIFKTVNMFLLKGDPNGRHNFPDKPVINIFLSALFFTGIISSLLKPKNHYHLLFLLIFLTGIIPSLLVYPGDNPSMLRTFGTLPAVIYFIGIGISYIFSKTMIKKRAIFSYLFLILITLSCLYELRTYFIFQPLSFKESFIMKNSLKTEIDNVKKFDNKKYKYIQ